MTSGCSCCRAQYGAQDGAPEQQEAPLRVAAQHVIDATKRAQAAEQEAAHLTRLLTAAQQVPALGPALGAPPHTVSPPPSQDVPWLISTVCSE